MTFFEAMLFSSRGRLVVFWKEKSILLLGASSIEYNTIRLLKVTWGSCKSL